jgi:hypothetical protein
MKSKLFNWLQKRAWPDLILPLLVYTAVVLFMTWPLVTQLSTHVAGPEYADSLEYLRLGWWGKYALQNGLNPFQQSLLGYPQGFFSAVQWAQPLIYWPISILAFVMNPTAAFNVWLMLEVILSGLTAYWLCRDMLRQMPLSSAILASLIGGLVFISFSTVQGHILGGHINPLANYMVPLVIMATLRIVDERGRWKAVLFGAVSLLVLALGNFTFLAYIALPLSIIVFIGTNIKFIREKQITWQILARLAAMFLLGAVLILPFYLPLAGDLLSVDRPAYLQVGGRVAFSTDPLAFINISSMTPWTAPFASTFSRQVLVPNAIEGSAYIGIVALLLVIRGWWVYRSKVSFWIALAALCMIFSLGPVLKWNNEPIVYSIGNELKTNVLMPFALFQNLPFISGTRTAGRFNILTGLALGVAAAYGLNSIIETLNRRNLHGRLKRLLPIAVTVLIGCAMLAEYQVSFPFLTSPTNVSSYFTQLADKPTSGAVLEIPFSDLIAQKEALLNQTYHHKPLIAGYVSRVTPVDPAKLEFLEQIATGENTISGSALDRQDRIALLRQNGISVIVYHWKLWQQRRTALTASATADFGKPVYEDEWRSIYEVPQAPTVATTPFTMTYSATGWWRGKDSVAWLKDSASVLVYAPKDETRTIHFSMTPLLYARKIEVSLDGKLVHITNVESPRSDLDLLLPLSAGVHTLTLKAVDGCTSIPVQPVCVTKGSSDLSSESCKLPVGETQVCVSAAVEKVDVSATLSNTAVKTQLSSDKFSLTLKAVQIPQQVQAGEIVSIQSLWQSDSKPQGDYHIFVHLIDSNGSMIAQSDSVPGTGAYPTALWAVNQTWMESSRLSLPSDMKPGKYSVYTGWYSYPDLTRLKVNSTLPHAQDGLLYLGDIEVK